VSRLHAFLEGSGNGIELDLELQTEPTHVNPINPANLEDNTQFSNSSNFDENGIIQNGKTFNFLNIKIEPNDSKVTIY